MQIIKRYYLNILYYAVALGITVLVTLVLSLFRNTIGIQAIALLYLLPVVFCTTLWGLGPGIVSAFASFLAFNYEFIFPYYTFNVHQSQDVLVLVVFLIVAVVISQLLGQAKAGIAAATSREREATQLYELSMALSGLQDVESIANRLAEQILETFCADQVEIKLNPKTGLRGPVRIVMPEVVPPAKGETVSYPLSTLRGQHGQIRIKRCASRLDPREERLLKTYMSQGALAIERAILAEEGQKARLVEESDRLKSVLLSSVPHELRTPLATIKASVTMLLGDTADLDAGSRHELLAAIEEETDHLNFLIGNLLDMSRIEMGALRPQRAWNSLDEIIHTVLHRMRKITEKHTVQLDIPPDLPLVPVDYSQMEQVFTNLISNSVKYAPEGTLIRIQASLDQGQHLLVRLSNQGPAVPEEHLGRIFDKFYRITSADRITGTGLGLSICKGIIEAHQGEIWAENAPGEFVFKIRLPLAAEGMQKPHLEDQRVP